MTSLRPPFDQAPGVVFTRPHRFLLRMLLFVVAVVAIGAVLFQSLAAAFFANAPLNGLILGVLVLGILYNFRQVLLLRPEVRWVENFHGERAPISEPHPPQLLLPMATMLRDRKARLSLSALAMRSLLDGIASRLEESRDLSRYTIGLLIFLGLLGTFWGLMQTVSSIGGVIGTLSVEGSDIATVFNNLKQGLQQPLSGMGTAFSTSLFGLGGSLILGFLDLQAAQAQNRFYNDLEEWLSGITRLSSGGIGADSEQPVPAYVQALLEQTAESLENLQHTLARGEESRIATQGQLLALVDKIGVLTDQMRTEQSLMLRLAEGQSELRPILARLVERLSQGAVPAIDEPTRAHIRNLEAHVARLLGELSSGREEIIRQVRSEIKLLARTIAAAAEQPKD
jgi:hypothetical protein